MTDFVAATRVFYDAIAEDYFDRFRSGLADQPLERAVLTAYAEFVRGSAGPGSAGRGSAGRGSGGLASGGGSGQVADLGCGPGWVTGFLDSLGLSVFGLDVSASMLAVARREHPGIRFEQGSMLELDLADGTLAGVVSWYSTIHTPADRLPALFAEFRRVLAPGGQLLLGFQAGDVHKHHDRPFGRPVSMTFQRRRPEWIAELLTEAGFTLTSQTVRAANEEAGESSAQAFLMARRP
ncbi:class I SAM-dependent methyltransferase [Streptomyces sp. AK08-02]|uniref:class I SAM-dependent methyltransferase n=1 Tax=Streptomyces sp. AK08-02 TaxID=3028654 RepID=UPI0029B7CCBB|nr:class I SAM-dependent methyltransferase [Streptomyces sp. AK08-02]MDX3747869.1 class I SAM-dependent methyltransferase [Streptomyces sp. AK08-02]